MIRNIFDGDQLIATVISHNYQEKGVNFITPDEATQQVAYMHLDSGKVIQPHIHNPVPRFVEYTQEVLVIKRGKLRIDFYSTACQYLSSCVVQSGDVALLASGGHGFEVLEELEMFEIKQGPYIGERDRTRFPGIDAQQATVLELSPL